MIAALEDRSRRSETKLAHRWCGQNAPDNIVGCRELEAMPPRWANLLQGCAHVVSLEITGQRLVPSAMEPRSTIGEVERDGQATAARGVADAGLGGLLAGAITNDRRTACDADGNVLGVSGARSRYSGGCSIMTVATAIQQQNEISDQHRALAGHYHLLFPLACDSYSVTRLRITRARRRSLHRDGVTIALQPGRSDSLNPDAEATRRITLA